MSICPFVCVSLITVEPIGIFFVTCYKLLIDTYSLNGRELLFLDAVGNVCVSPCCKESSPFTCFQNLLLSLGHMKIS